VIWIAGGASAALIASLVYSLAGSLPLAVALGVTVSVSVGLKVDDLLAYVAVRRSGLLATRAEPINRSRDHGTSEGRDR
jgi:hypothetical protein